MLEIRETIVYRGPNVWARMPSIRLLVDIGDLEARPTNLIPGFTDRLLTLIPSLVEHFCSRGHRGGFVERLHEGTWMGHVLEHVALELQLLAGATVGRGKTRVSAESGVYNVVYEYKQEDVGRTAGRLAMRLLNHLIFDAEPEFDYGSERDELILLAARLAFGPSTGAIVDEAERRGIPTLRLDPRRSVVQLGHGRHQRRIWATMTSSTSHVAVLLAASKESTNRLLRDVGIPAPEGTAVTSIDAAVQAAERMGFPVVLKPVDGNHGRGVCIDLQKADAVRAAYPTAAGASRDGTVLVERFVAGKDYRVLVIDDVVVAVSERVPAHVVGDGERAVRTLIEATNADPRRGVGHEKTLTRITVDEQTIDLLARQGLTLEAVPQRERIVPLKLTGNMSTGGTAIDRTDEIHPDNAEIARQAAMVVGLDIAGIDFVMPDISRSVREVGGGIVEVNAAPGFRMHTHPTEGLPRQVGRAVVDMLFPAGAPARVPIVAVTGTNGKTTTSRMIAHIMQCAGQTVGLTSTDGIYIGGTQIAAGDMAGPDSARLVLKNPRVDFAVLETARGGILRSGLGFDRCNIAVVTNVASDHLGLKGVETLDDLANVKSVVPASVFRDGASVLNADNHWTVEMTRAARGEIIFFSLDADNPVIGDHLRERGRAVVLKQTAQGEMLTLFERKSETSILLASDIPATADGRIRANIANALAACAAAVAADVGLECIRAALREFGNGFAQTPGRFNLLSIEGRQVVMDYGHNAGALASMAEFVKRTAAPQTIGVITMPGDRRDDDFRAYGRVAGETFDRVIVREGADRRGRPVGEVAGIIREAILAAGLPDDRVTIVLDEIEAAHAGIDLASPGDLVVVQADRVGMLWAALQERANREAPVEPPAQSTPPLSRFDVPSALIESAASAP